MLPQAQTLAIIGMIIGEFVSGWTADRFVYITASMCVCACVCTDLQSFTVKDEVLNLNFLRI